MRNQAKDNLRHKTDADCCETSIIFFGEKKKYFYSKKTSTFSYIEKKKCFNFERNIKFLEM
jgi:hypothetical protein